MNKVRFSLCREDIIYRIFGLFPYYDKNENGDFVLYKATENVDGCYGKISCSFKLPQNVKLIVGGITLLEAGKIYSYKTLENLYYKYKDTIDSNTEGFIEFMERGMGRTKVDKEEGWVLVPDYINIAECEDLLKELLKLKKLIDNYQNDGNEADCDIACVVKEFNQKGGNKMIEKYRGLLETRKEISNDYYEYAINSVDNTPYNTTIDFNINFVSKYKDLGIAESYPVWDNKNFELFRDELTEDVDLKSGVSNSLLTNFRQFTDYIPNNNNGDDTRAVITPDDGTDWLFYYKMGYVADYDIAIDSDGNIAIKEGKNRNDVCDSVNYETNLEAYGDVLIDITEDRDKRTVTFKYVIGGHLKAHLVSVEADELNKIHYCYDDFVYDTEDKYHGVVYTETYPYDINQWVDKETFGKMIEGEELNEKGVFILTDNLISSKADFDGDIDYSYIAADYEATISKEKDYIMKSPIVRPDYYIGITHEPIIRNNVKFSRGNAAAFERHIKLGEVKSFDDLENYSNGGFFNMV